MWQKFKSICLFMLLVVTLQTHAHAGEFENPRARATFDVCIELDSKRAELFKQMLSPPYSCAVNMEPQNVGDPSSEEFKVAYAQNLKFTRGFPNIVEYCAVVVMYCIADAPPITVENKKSATDTIAKRWYPELIK